LNGLREWAIGGVWPECTRILIYSYMNRFLKLKPEFDKTVQRFEAWWQGEVLDRPPISLQRISTKDNPFKDKVHSAPRDFWMDSEYLVDRHVVGMRAGFQHDHQLVFPCHS
jgi:hypothetical protein